MAEAEVIKLDTITRILKKHKQELKDKYGVKEIGIFGSYVRGEQRETSDLDILVDFDSIPSLFDLVELQDYLSTVLQVKIDLVMKTGLKPRIGRRILNEVILI